MPDAIDLLTQDHERVRDLLKTLVDSEQESQRTSTLRKLEQEIKVHSHIEEEIFYPAYREAVDERSAKQLYHESLEEHAVVDKVLADFKKVDPSSPEFEGKAQVLKELIEHHADEEEEDMFKQAREAMAQDELDRLGKRMEQEKERFEPSLELAA